MRIPLEHFNNTPVFALSPTSDRYNNNDVVDNGHNLDSSYSNDNAKSLHIPHAKEKKLSLPDSLGLLDNKSVGSAPNSPKSSKRISPFDENVKKGQNEVFEAIATISNGIQSSEAANTSSTPSSTASQFISKYATLPTK